MANDFLNLFAAVVLAAGQPNGCDPSTLGPKVLLVGDSNVGTTLAGEFIRRASLRDRPWSVVSVSTTGSGWRHTNYWAPHLTALVASERPAAVVINLGTNDAIAADFGAYWRELPAQVDAVLASVPAETPVVLLGVPPDVRFANLDCLGPVLWLNLFVLPAAAAARPLTTFVPVDANRLGPDGVHYSEEGGRLTGAAAYAAASAALLE